MGNQVFTESVQGESAGDLPPVHGSSQSRLIVRVGEARLEGKPVDQTHHPRGNVSLGCSTPLRIKHHDTRDGFLYASGFTAKGGEVHGLLGGGEP